MTIFDGNEEIPEICHFCGEFEQKVDLATLNMKIWGCVNSNCILNKTPESM